MKKRCLHIFWLIKKDWLLEKRNKFVSYSVLLYLICTIFLLYITIGTPEDKVWNGLFWITELFVCVNAVAKSFIAEGRGRMLYYYMIVQPVDFMLSKLIYNAIAMMVLSLLGLLIFCIFLSNPFAHIMHFIWLSLIGSVSISLVFSFLSALAAKAEQNSSFVVILGFPLLIPQLLLLSKLSQSAFVSIVQAGWIKLFFVLVGYNILVIALSVILFPFLWKD